ncbi:hypothetical protein KSC_097390 [Ktedonobacter sp. SOSP1-52]|uniref:helix-turn-helix domain-containing protein n=1 Tax=Ktedonobacter sp. SOSP1-52 TaxID=2778366 RepID=UPI001915C7AA|nr:helix-turn-helix transcriptional regulator [Ktedonobacter sp. SOSP1-52]GHO70847.1 hypothetical protein KSC_097390 [Ktedonobacter sp. SOSP1-52]
MQESLGKHLRQLRRQRSFTQTDLGSHQYSKSYISAIERDAIIPSPQALSFFEEQLGLPQHYFEQWTHSDETTRSLTFSLSSQHLAPSLAEATNEQEKFTELLDLLLASSDHVLLTLTRAFASLSPQTVTAFPLAIHARQAFFEGLVAQEKGEPARALPPLEYAMALSPLSLRPFVLDAVGSNYYRQQEYRTALLFHRRALQQISEQKQDNNAAHDDLALILELHCGNDCRALTSHEEARTHYEHAQKHLRASHNMEMAGQLYHQLSYCTYASLFPTIQGAQQPKTPEQIEWAFQRAISFCVQGKLFYQTSHEQAGISLTQMLHVMILLDYSAWKQQRLQEERESHKVLQLAQCTRLLESAEEQCQQFFQEWQAFSGEGQLPAQLQQTCYILLAFLVRVYEQHAQIAQISGYEDTAMLQRSRACYLCQQIINTFAREEQLSPSSFATLYALVRKPITTQHLALPELPNPNVIQNIQHNMLGWAEIAFAAGAVAEGLTQLTQSREQIANCYAFANQCFQLALTHTRQAIRENADAQYDTSYFTRAIQRCQTFLEQRLRLLPEEPDTREIQKLLAMVQI